MEFYHRELADIAWLTTPHVPDECDHGWQAYVRRVDERRAPCPRNEIMRRLEAQGVSTRLRPAAPPGFVLHDSVEGYSLLHRSSVPRGSTTVNVKREVHAPHLVSESNEEPSLVR